MSRKKFLFVKLKVSAKFVLFKKKFWIKDEVFLLNAYSQYYCLIEKSFLFAYERKVFIDTISVVI